MVYIVRIKLYKNIQTFYIKYTKSHGKKIKKYVKKNRKCDNEMTDNIYDIMMCKQDYISFKKLQDLIGYKKKGTIKEVLLKKKYGFVEGKDYILEKQKSSGGRPRIDIKLHVDAAKMICFMSPTTKGQQFRRYYIEMDNLFRKCIAEELINKVDDPIPELHKKSFDVNKYKNKEVLYLIYIKDKTYKFGITDNLYKRLSRHRKDLNYKYVIKCWDCTNRTVSKKVENDIKRYLRTNKLKSVYKNLTEVLETDNINNIVKIFDQYVTRHITEYENQFKDKRLEQQLEILKQVEKMSENNPNIDVNNIISNMMNEIDIQEKPTLPDPLEEQDLLFCKRCRKHKKHEDFGINLRTKAYYKQCTTCRTEQKKVDQKRSQSKTRQAYIKKRNKEYHKKNKKKISKRKMERRKANRERKKRVYSRDREKILERNKQYYRKNRDQIIEQKRNKALQNMLSGGEPDTMYCKGCRKYKHFMQFEINLKTKTYYKQCNKCKNK